MMIDNTVLMDYTIMSADLSVPVLNISVDGKCAREVMLTLASSSTGWILMRSRCGLAWMKVKGRRIPI